jgi:hypothetical protein
VILSRGGLLRCSGFELGILLGDGGLDLLLLVVLEPFHFLLAGLLEQDVLLPGLINVLQEVDPGLLFSLPLGLSHFVLSLGLLLHEFIDQLLVGSFVGLRLLVILLELNDFPAAFSSLSLLNILEGLFSSKSGRKEFLVSLLFGFGLNGSEFPLGGVVVDELDVPLSVQDEFLSLGLLISVGLLGPLLFEHCLFSGFLLGINLLGLRNCVLLPGENVESFLDLLLLVGSLLLLSLHFLLVVEHPEFGVDLLLNDGLLQLMFLVHELLFSFNLGSCDHESGLFPSQVIGLHFELPLECVLNLLGPLFFSLLLESIESIGHFSSHLLWSFKISQKFLLVLFILCG